MNKGIRILIPLLLILIGITNQRTSKRISNEYLQSEKVIRYTAVWWCGVVWVGDTVEGFYVRKIPYLILFDLT